MSNLARVTQLGFASTAGIDQIGVFGSLAASSPTYTTNPATVQSLSNYLAGWFAAVVGENSPAIQDMNGLCFLFSYQLQYILQKGVAEWDSGTTYYTGNIVQDGSGNLYYSLTNSNTGNALTSVTNWAVQGNNFRTVTASSVAVSATDNVIRSNSTSGNILIIFPSVSLMPVGKKVTIKDVGTGGFHTTVESLTDPIDGNLVYSSVLNQYDSLTVFNNGVSWDVI